MRTLGDKLTSAFWAMACLGAAVMLLVFGYVTAAAVMAAAFVVVVIVDGRAG